MNCMTFELLSRVPVPGMRLRFCRWHVARCRRCRQESDRSDKAGALLIAPDRLSPAPDLWPEIRKRVIAVPLSAAGLEPVLLPARRSWRWAFAAAMLVLTLLAGFWVLFLGRNMGPHPSPVEQRPAVQAKVCSAKIADRPARVFQVQSRNPDRTIFWIAKENTRG